MIASHSALKIIYRGKR